MGLKYQLTEKSHEVPLCCYLAFPSGEKGRVAFFLLRMAYLLLCQRCLTEHFLKLRKISARLIRLESYGL